MGRMGPGLTSMAMCSCMLTRGRRRLLAAAAPAMGAQTCGGGSEKAPQTGDEGAAPNELGRGGITEGSEGVLGGSRDLRTEHGEGVGGERDVEDSGLEEDPASRQVGRPAGLLTALRALPGLVCCRLCAWLR